MPHTIRKKIEAFQWLGFTLEERFKRNLPVTYEEYAEKNQVSTRQLSNWKAEYDKVQSEKNLIEGEEPDNVDEFTADDWKEYLQTKKMVAAKALVRALRDGKYNAIEGFFKLLGEFIEKTEQVNIELSAADYIRIARETDEGLREFNQEHSGSPALLKEPEILPD